MSHAKHLESLPIRFQPFVRSIPHFKAQCFLGPCYTRHPAAGNADNATRYLISLLYDLHTSYFLTHDMELRHDEEFSKEEEEDTHEVNTVNTLIRKNQYIT